MCCACPPPVYDLGTMTPKSTPVRSDFLISGRDGSLVGPVVDALGVDELKVEFAANSAGRVVVRKLIVGHPQGISATLLRRLPVLQAERKYAQGLKQLHEFMHRQNLNVGITEIKKILASRTGLARHRNFPDEFFVEVARAYTSAVGLGDVAPSLTIAHYTKTPVPTVKGWVRRARLRGALPPARRGAAG